MSEARVRRRVRERREAEGWTQGELAARVSAGSRGDRTQSWVSRVEVGTTPLYVEDLVDLARALRVDVRWLLLGDEGVEHGRVSTWLEGLRSLEELLDERGLRIVSETALIAADDAQRARAQEIRAIEEIINDVGLPPAIMQRVVEAAYERFRRRGGGQS